MKTEDSDNGACIVALVSPYLTNPALLEQLLTDGGYHAVLDSLNDTIFRFVYDELPALVLLNVASAVDADALRLLKLLRLNQRTRQIPTIVRTADLHQLRRRVERLGLRWCRLLHQSCTEAELLAAIREAIDSRAGKRGPL
ncbi:MAG: hypothetical protein M3R24_11725 [Chloroflexota bacterium]|nr:hypothetical protein [Chloroflexota bacterium]